MPGDQRRPADSGVRVARAGVDVHERRRQRIAGPGRVDTPRSATVGTLISTLAAQTTTITTGTTARHRGVIA